MFSIEIDEFEGDLRPRFTEEANGRFGLIDDLGDSDEEIESFVASCLDTDWLLRLPKIVGEDEG